MTSLRWLSCVLVLLLVILAHPRVAPANIEVIIDIKPGSDENPINPNSRGVVPVAILGSGDFSVNRISVDTVRFGTNGGAAPLDYRGHLEDVNGDNILDLVLLFRLQETGITDGAVEACLSGLTTNGEGFYGCDSARTTRLDSSGLIFPFKNPLEIVEVYCFGIYPWDQISEIHGGFDLVPQYKNVGYRKYQIVAPADAMVDRRIPGTTGTEAFSLTVLLRLNEYWYVICTFEPQSSVEEVVNEQVKSIYVKEGQKVRKGEVIGELVVSEPDILGDYYPHIHYGFFYKHPEDTVDDLIQNYLAIPRSDGTNLPPLTGKGSPWHPENLGISTTLFCPYVYSSPQAKVLYDSYPKRALYGNYCTCLCAYGSENGDCGVCEP